MSTGSGAEGSGNATTEPAAVSDWKCLIDKKTGKKYYYSKSTKKTSWKKPADWVAPDWTETLDKASGKRYYYNKKTKKTSWKKPDSFVPLATPKVVAADDDSKKQTMSTNGRPSSTPQSTAITKSKSAGGGEGEGEGEGEGVSVASPKTRRKKPNPQQGNTTTGGRGGGGASEEGEGKRPEKPSSVTGAGTTSLSSSSSSSSSSSIATPSREEMRKNGYWKESYDPRAKKNYYYHTRTKKTTWKKPDEYVAPASTSKSRKPKETAIPEAINEEPSDIAQDELESKKGTTPGNPSTRKTPTGSTETGGGSDKKKKRQGEWRQQTDKKTGRPYYYHSVTKQVSWQKPKDFKKPTVAIEDVNSPVALAAALARAQEEKQRAEEAELENYDSDDEDGDFFAAEIDSIMKARSAVDASRRKESVIQSANGAPKFNIEIDTFLESFKLLPRTQEEELLLRRLDLINIEEPEADDRIPKVINMRKGMFYQLVRLLKKHPRNVQVVSKTMLLLKKYGSLDEHVIKAVENDIVGRTIAMLTLHMNDIDIVGSAIVLLGNLALNDYVKELIRMEEGVKVISVLMSHPEHVEDPDVLDKCCYCLANMAVGNPENVKDIINGGSLKSILRSMEDFPDSEKLIDSGTVVLSNLCAGGEKQRKQIAEMGAIRALVSTVLSPHVNLPVMNDCLQALGNLALHQDTIDYLIDDQAVPALVRVIKLHTKLPELVQLAISVLGNMSAFCDHDQTLQVIRQGAIDAILQAVRNHAHNTGIQVAFLGSMSHFAKSAQSSKEKQVDQVMLDTVQPTMLVINAAIEKPKIVVRGLGLLAKIASVKTRAQTMVNENIGDFYRKTLEMHLERGNSKAIREIFASLGVLSTETTSQKLVTVELVKIINFCLVSNTEKLDGKVLDAALKCVRVLSCSQIAALRIVQECIPNFVKLGQKYLNNAAIIDRLTSIFGQAAIFAGTMEHMTEANVGPLLLDMLEAHSASADVVFKILAALTNMMLADDMFASMMKAAQAEVIIKPIVAKSPGHAQLRNASLLFYEKVNEAKELKEAADEPRKYHQMDQEEKHEDLQKKFNIPKVNPRVRNLLAAGHQMRYHRVKGKREITNPAPVVVHVYLTQNGRFINLREPHSEKVIEEDIPMRKFKAVASGCCTHELTRKYFIAKSAKEPLAFALIGKEEEDPDMSFEMDTEELRDRFFDAFEQVLAYRHLVEERRKELTDEELKAYL